MRWASSSHPTIRLLILLLCLPILPCHAAEPAANAPTHGVDRSACGDAARWSAFEQKILETIRNEVLRRTAPENVMIERQDLDIQACPQAAFIDSELVIKRAEYDAPRGISVFWLASSRAGNTVPPLIVTVRKQRSLRVLVTRHELRTGQAVSINDFAEATQLSGNLLSPAAELWGSLPNPSHSEATAKKPSSEVKSKPVLLVKIGVPAELALLGKNFRGKMPVIPLESGSLGDELRVRDPGTHNIIRAKVTSVNQLEEIF